MKKNNRDGTHILKENYSRMGEGEPDNPIVDLFLEKITPDELIDNMRKESIDEEEEVECRANFYIGEYYMLKGNNTKAIECFKKCRKTSLKNLIEFRMAGNELSRLDK